MWGSESQPTPFWSLLGLGSVRFPSSSPTAGTTSTLRSPHDRWARLLARMYEVLPLLYPFCGGGRVSSWSRDVAHLQSSPLGPYAGVLVYMCLKTR